MATAEIPLLSGPGLGTRAINLGPGDAVIGFRVASGREPMRAVTPGGQTRLIGTGRFPTGRRGGRGRRITKSGFARVEAGLRLPEPLAGRP